MITVVIVEDDRELADWYVECLADEFAVRVATTGAEALEVVDDGVDVLLLDRRLPDIDGDEVLSTLRDRGFTGRVAVLSGVEPDLESIDMAFDDYVTKPVTADQLPRTVEKLHTRHEYSERLQRLFTLASKRAALEGVVPLEDLESSERYRSLVAEIDALQRDISTHLERFDATDFRAVFREISRSPIAVRNGPLSSSDDEPGDW